MQTKKEKQAEHLRNLVLLAISDNHFDESEIRMIIKIAMRMGLSCSEFENYVLNRPEANQLPESLPEKISHLHDLFRVMAADQVITGEEQQLITEFIHIYGLKEIPPKKSRQPDLLKAFQNREDYQRFLTTFRQSTKESLSPVSIDERGQIRFPEYSSAPLKVSALARTLYIFFLFNSEGARLVELYNHHEDLLCIYDKMPYARVDAKERIEGLTNGLGEGFNPRKAKINKAIEDLLPDHLKHLAGEYKIQRGADECMRVPIAANPDRINVSDNFRKLYTFNSQQHKTIARL